MVHFDLPPDPHIIETAPLVVVESIHQPGGSRFLKDLLAATAIPAESAVAVTEDESLPSLEPASPNDNGAEEPANQIETDSPTPDPSSGDRPTIEPFPTNSSPTDLPTIEPSPTEPSPTEPSPTEPSVTEPSAAELADQLRLTADYQDYDPDTQIVTARGNVVLRLGNDIIEANELWVNLINRYALATGDVLLTRGAQIVRGSRAEYSFTQRSGVIRDAVGTLYFPTAGDDFSSPVERRFLPGGSTATGRAYDPLSPNSPLQVTSDGSIQIVSSPEARLTGGTDGSLRQLRFETDELRFDVEGWRAESARITNDPFSPPELELRVDNLLLRNLSVTQDELLFQRPRLVFDQGLALPLFRSRLLLNRGQVDPEELSPLPVQVGVDGRDRGGFFIGRKIPIIKNGRTQFSITPQYSVARALSGQNGSPLDLNNFGATADLSSQLTPRLTLSGRADLTGLGLSNLTENLRANLRAEQLIGNHTLAVDYSYRDRLFNGSLGFQDVQYSLGVVLLSPTINLNPNLQLTYQGSAQLINAASDRADLLAASGSNTGRITLGRYQASAALRQSINLWTGEPKPATQAEGLRFTPTPVVPYLNLSTGLRLTTTAYSSGDQQNSAIADIGISGQIGHFARNFGDYTSFNLGYAQSFLGVADSPFLFDREVDRSILYYGINQQIYGPFLLGFQSAYSFSQNRAISSIFTLEYSRRTYGILIRYDATQSSAAIGFRLSNFSWLGDTDPFDTPRVRQVRGGVLEQRN